MTVGMILLTDAIAEVGRLKSELEQTRAAAKVFEHIWQTTEDDVKQLRVLVQCLLDNDHYDLDVWRKDAHRVLKDTER